MTEQHAVRLGTVQETLLIPLYGRAVENRKEEPVLRDPRAEEIVDAIDYDFTRFDNLPSLLGTVLRTTLFDHWVADFLTRHPTGTVVEIGTGLNTRYERVDNGQARWFESDLPDVIELRRAFFDDTPRRTAIAASVTDRTWAETVAARSDGPYLFAAEAVLPFLPADEVRRVVDLIAETFPGSLLALDTAGTAIIGGQEQHDALSKVEARMQWACDDPAEITAWRPGARLLTTCTLTTLPTPLHDRLPAADREMLANLAGQRLSQVEEYRLNLLQLP
ncbi:class I SAM-dependent methyltransferase [Streptomyces sp. YS415]|uniref:class I SAM-dependent methyltransferase n=1 Tax=Streptomyces sp. YS415 TaxID=2944806 RepID=UPI00201FD1FA|nr:class I SAM-dependent methyltransferase [Streptomyces sp. YS415]MCL7430350.1 class I SAM-dependent methyltransferase [Streptomyces sp. YS415]